MIFSAISIQQPWSYAIYRLGKDVENRSWLLPLRYDGRPVLVHSGQKIDKAGHEYLDSLGHPIGANILRGGILGFAVFTMRGPRRRSRWDAVGQYNWRIIASGELPFHPCRGSLGFFKVDYPHEAACEDFLRSLGLGGLGTRSAV
ncbi:MAG: RNA-binding protein [Desulfovibrionaceae bacterium]|nr:RNA-binding protein [Desulfovibrionaceae bacterium]